MRLADYLTNYLYELGVKNVFMLSGTGSIHLDDAFANQDGMNYICARHEAAAVTMAAATAKLTGKIGVVIATTGPGGTNAIGGVAEAWVDSVPVLIISGQVKMGQISEGVRSFGIQGFNIIENVIGITKYAKKITNPHRIRYHLEKAIHKATTGRPGPVWLDIPLDIQAEIISLNKLNTYTPQIPIYNKKNNAIKSTIDALCNSKKPLIVFGQGIRNSGAVKELMTMLDLFKIPSIAARLGIDILPYTNPYYFGLGGLRGQKGPVRMLKECDLIIALGTSFTHAFAGENYDEVSLSAKIIMVNVDKSEMNKPGLNIDIAVEMDAKHFISEIINDTNINEKSINFSEWLEKCKIIKNDFPTFLPTMKGNPINSYYFIESINRNSNENSIFVNDAGSANYICSQGLKLSENQRELTSGAFYSMGVAVPLGIGASVTEPESQVIVITGDGSIELNIQELRTISHNDLNMKIFVINNGGYASIRKSQDDMVGGRYTDDGQVLNFLKVANAFELPFHIIENCEKLDKEISNILNTNGPALIEVVCDTRQEIIEPFDY